MKFWPVVGIALLQAFLLLAHWFIFHTTVSFWALGPKSERALAVSLFGLAISFVVAALLSYRVHNPLVELLYKLAALWLGLLNFLFWASWICWVIELPLRWAGEDSPALRHTIVGTFYALAISVAIFGLINARHIRERHLQISLASLPPSWRGRRALLITDMHLGNVNGRRFAERIAAIAHRLSPDVIFIAGDLFDGSKLHPERIAAPVLKMRAPHGIYFCGGNHEDFGEPDAYEAVLEQAGIRVLHSERIDVDGLQLVGISYSDSIQPLRLRSFLDGLRLESGPASILLNHVPNRLPIVEHAGVALQLSGHTHGGQMFPFTWVTRRAFGKFTYGLQRYGNLQVLTSSGAGTWGPPMRVGTSPEVVLITFV